MDYIDIVFDGPPEHEAGRFVEVEDPQGQSVGVGEWVHRDDGFWVLRLPDHRTLLSQIATLQRQNEREIFATQNWRDRAKDVAADFDMVCAVIAGGSAGCKRRHDDTR